MNTQRKKSGQALIEYAFLMVLLATISFAVIALAGNQLRSAFDDISYEIAHFADTTTLAPDGATLVSPGATPAPNSCPPGKIYELRGHKWKCK